MKKSSIFICILAISALITACTKEEKTIETNARGVPLKVADVIMGDTYSIDTLYTSETRTVVFIDNPQYNQNVIYQGEEILANSPTLEVDTINVPVYQISDLLRSTRVNFGNEQSIERFRREFPQYTDFSTVVVGDSTETGQKATFAFAVSVPKDGFKNASDIKRWVETCLNDTLPYTPSIKAFGEKMEHDFFDAWSKEESEFMYTNSRSMLVYEVTPQYVTYFDFFWGFLGGAHGMYCYRFVTYSLEDNCPVTASSLLNPEYADEVRELIYEALASDEDFMSQNRLTSLSQARTFVQRYLNGEQLPIPDPALLSQGVIFCYQPYEIGPYAAGSFQLLVPYDKIAPYLNKLI